MRWMSPTPKSGRQIVMEELNKEIQLAMTGDLHRAADFLKGAREIRAGSKKQRRISREAQRNAWKKDADLPARW